MIKSKSILILLISVFIFNTVQFSAMAHEEEQQTDSAGAATFDVPIGEFEITVTKEGYTGGSMTTSVIALNGKNVISSDIILAKAKPDKSGNNHGGGGGIIYRPSTPNNSNSTDFSHDDYISKFSQLNLRKNDMYSPALRVEIAALFSEMFNVEEKQDKIKFPDIEPNSWYSGAVERVTRKGLMIGDTEGTFRPFATISRAEIAAVIVRTMGYSENADTSFSDITPEYWAAEYISKITASGVMIGDTEGTFRPDSGITREEVIIIINRLLGEQE